jgi:hypothetical protein
MRTAPLSFNQTKRFCCSCVGAFVALGQHKRLQLLEWDRGAVVQPIGIVGQQRMLPAALATLSEKGMSTLRAIAN